MDEQIKKLIENDLVINDLPLRRVPKKQLAWFKEYAKEEFANDYGMLLRELIQFYRGMYVETMLSGIDLAHNKLDKVLEVLEGTPKESTSQGPKMANGKVLGIERR